MNVLFDPAGGIAECAQIVEHNGRSGFVLNSVHGSVCVGSNPVSTSEIGSLAVWILPFEDIGPIPHWPQHNRRNPQSQSLVFLSDHPVRRDARAAVFALFLHTFWHPGLLAYNGYKKGNPQLVAATGHTHLKARNWSQIVVTWNKPANRAALYVNGILQGTSDAQMNALVSSPKKAATDPAGPLLYAGGTNWATGGIHWSEEEISADAVRAQFIESVGMVDENEQNKMEKRYLGKGLDRMPPAGSGWQAQLELSLCKSEDLLEFHPQGGHDAARITDEGMRVTTALAEPSHDFSIQDSTHVYLWTKRFFYGAQRVRFEFKTKRRGGLGLLMTQCSGMQGEDHLADYPQDTNGIMQPVCWEDIRNYHWEYYREMNDVRNDVASHAMVKNPFYKPVDFRVQGPLLEVDRWYTLEFRQDGSRILGAIDGMLVIDGTDDFSEGHGPLLSQGRLALRCMCRTDMVFRNLTVETKPRFSGGDISPRVI
jgi:hypothetical protein